MSASFISYLIYAIVSLSALVYLFYMSRFKHRVEFSLILWGFLLVLVGLGGWSAYKAAENQYKQVEDSIHSLVPTFAVEMKRLGHEKINLETKPDDPTYL